MIQAEVLIEGVCRRLLAGKRGEAPYATDYSVKNMKMLDQTSEGGLFAGE